MQKVSITLDLTKIDKSLITERSYQNAAGETVVAKEYKMELVPLKEKKLIKDGGSWQMFKTHFLAQPQTKEEREKKVPSVFLGDGITFENSETAPAASNAPAITEADVPW